MLILEETGSVFCAGACEFTCQPATQGERLNRLLLPFSVGGLETQSVVDTGDAYLILEPVYAAMFLNLDSLEELGADSLTVRGRKYPGRLFRIEIALLATRGESLSVEVVLFLPTLEIGEQWPLPHYLGWHGCLENLRLAFDPVSEIAYFGSGN